MWRFRHVARHFVNPVMRRVAGKLPGFGVLTYRGRKTGRTYQTPVNVFRRGDAYFFFLTYGSDAQKWVRNVLATGSCLLETRGRIVKLIEPEHMKTSGQLGLASVLRGFPAIAVMRRRSAGGSRAG
jgi:deazaflavin-dependent oxidoreductase (nitroreductase family)